MTNYSRGADFERAIMKDLAADGYYVIRSAGSHSHVDVVAIKPGQLLMIQAKKNGVISPAERKELLRIGGMINWSPQVTFTADLALPIVAWHRPGVAKPQYWLLDGVGPHDRQEWHADEVAR